MWGKPSRQAADQIKFAVALRFHGELPNRMLARHESNGMGSLGSDMNGA